MSNDYVDLQLEYSGNHSACETYPEDQKNRLLISNACCAFVSFLFCLVTVSVVFAMKLHKHFIYRLAMYQIVSSMLVTITEVLYLTLLDYHNDEFQDIACQITAFLLEYTAWMKATSTTCLIFHLFCLAVFLRDFRRLEVFYLVLPLCLPALISWIPFVNHSYGESGAWCWIKSWKGDCVKEKYLEGIIEQFALWYGPLFLFLSIGIVSVLIILVVLIWRGFKNRAPIEEQEALITNHERESNKKALKELIPLLIYPAIFYLLNLFPLTHRIYLIFSNQASYVLAFGHSVSVSLWGFFSSIALLMHIVIARKLKLRKNNETNSRVLTSVQTESVGYTTNSSGWSPPPESFIDDE